MGTLNDGELERMSVSNGELKTNLRALDDFLVDNPELEKLDARLSTFNIFNVLRISRAEIRHSNILGWLLSPDENHGLGSLFLRRFLTRLLMNNDSDVFKFRPAQIELMDLSDATVRREWKNIDLLAFSYAGKWCLLIENKIYSKESEGQLLRYLATVREQFSHFEVAPVYLTLEGEDPSDEALEAGFMSFGHNDVLEILEQLVLQHRSRIPDDARVLLDHYIEALRRLTMQDTELSDLCRDIYRKHRQAIDLIVEYGAVSDISGAMEAQLRSEIDCEFIALRTNQAWFLPKSLGASLPTQEGGWWFLPRRVPLIYRAGLNRNKQSFHMIFEIGPMDDDDVRLRLAETVQAAGFKVGKKGLSGDAKFTRILRINHKALIDDGEPDYSSEAVEAAVTAMWNKVSKDAEKLEEILKNFDWSSS